MVLSGLRSERDWKTHLQTGRVISNEGQTPAFAFPSATYAVRFALAMVLHSVDEVRAAVITGDDWEADTCTSLVSTGASALEAAEVGQIVVSLATQELVRRSIPEIRSFDDLGTYDAMHGGSSERLFLIRHAGLRISRRAARTETNQRHTPFLGRTRELEMLARLIERSRLVTVLGLPGTGKTAFVRHFAGQAAESFSNQVYSFDLRVPSGPSVLLPHLARILEVRGLEDLPLEELILRKLERSSALLVFDGIESHLSELKSITGLILERCPNIAVLAAGQKCLGLFGEAKFRLAGLETPISVEGLSAVRESEAVSLFTERAQLVATDFQVDKQNADDLASLVDALGGHPLAIELAAAKANTLSPGQILDRIDDRLLLLRQPGIQAGEPSSLLGALEQGFQRLSEVSQDLLPRLSLFAGSFCLSAAQSLAENLEDPALLWDGFEELVDGGWLVTIGQRGNERFFRLPSTIRLFAGHKFRQSDGFKPATEAYNVWIDDFLVRAAAGLRTDDLSIWLALVDEHFLDISCRLTVLTTQSGALNKAAETVLHLAMFWYLRNYYREGLWWIEKILNRTAGIDAPIVERLYILGSQMSSALGEFKIAKARARIALRSAWEREDMANVAEAWNALGATAFLSGRMRSAVGCYRTALRKLPNGNLLRRQSLQTNIASALAELGRSRECHYLLDQLESEAGATGYGITRILSVTVQTRANAEIRIGNWAEGKRLCAVAIQHLNAVGNSDGLIRTLRLLALVALGEKNPKDAAVLLGAAHSLANASQSPISPHDRTLEDELKSSMAGLLSAPQMEACMREGMLQHKQIIENILNTVL